MYAAAQQSAAADVAEHPSTAINYSVKWQMHELYVFRGLSNCSVH